MTYRERKERRLERRQDWAISRDERARAAFNRVHAIADNIPLGQPILVGHHSEKHARRDQERIHNGMTRGCESQDMAKHHREVAAGIAHQLETSIYSDDPDAIEALEARIATLEAEREAYKEINRKIAAYQKQTGKANKDLTAADMVSIGITPRAASHFWPELYGYKIPPYKFTNLSGNINRQKKRLEMLKRRAAAFKQPWEMTFAEWRDTPPLSGEGPYWEEFHRAIMAKATFEEAQGAALRAMRVDAGLPAEEGDPGPQVPSEDWPQPKDDPQDQESCTNCQDPDNVKNGYVELWDGVCPDCGRLVDPLQGRMEDEEDASNVPSQQV